MTPWGRGRPRQVPQDQAPGQLLAGSGRRPKRAEHTPVDGLHGQRRRQKMALCGAPVLVVALKPRVRRASGGLLGYQHQSQEPLYEKRGDRE